MLRVSCLRPPCSFLVGWDGFLVLSILVFLLLLVLAPVLPRLRLGTWCMLRCLRCVSRFRLCPCWSCLFARAFVLDARFLLSCVVLVFALLFSSCLSPFGCLFLFVSQCCCLRVRLFSLSFSFGPLGDETVGGHECA